MGGLAIEEGITSGTGIVSMEECFPIRDPWVTRSVNFNNSVKK